MFIVLFLSIDLVIYCEKYQVIFPWICSLKMAKIFITIILNISYWYNFSSFCCWNTLDVQRTSPSNLFMISSHGPEFQEFAIILFWIIVTHIVYFCCHSCFYCNSFSVKEVVYRLAFLSKFHDLGNCYWISSCHCGIAVRT